MDAKRFAEKAIAVSAAAVPAADDRVSLPHAEAAGGQGAVRGGDERGCNAVGRHPEAQLLTPSTPLSRDEQSTCKASVGGTHKGTETDYTSFRGFILLRKPEMLRVIGLLPLVRTQAFDLVSDGSTFKLYIPSKTEVVEGKNSLTTKSPNQMLNLRPGMFFDSMLIRPVAPEDEVILTTDENVRQDPKTKKWVEDRYYLLSIVRAKGATAGTNAIRELIPRRVIRFSREDLRPIEQEVYDAEGNIETITQYGVPQSFGTEKFPGTITIKRPLEEYQIVMTIQKLILNQTLKDDQFQLDIPEGVKIQKLD